MISRKKTRKSQNPQFYFNNHPVEITQEYTYLGVKLPPSGTFTTAKEDLRVKAMHAFFSIRKYTNIYKLPCTKISFTNFQCNDISNSNVQQ